MSRKSKEQPLAFIPPMLAKRVAKLPEGPAWSYEAKFDGYRIEAIKAGSTARLLSRRGNDFTKKFGRVAKTVAKIKAKSAILDGEGLNPPLRAKLTKLLKPQRSPNRALPGIFRRILRSAHKIFWRAFKQISKLPLR